MFTFNLVNKRFSKVSQNERWNKDTTQTRTDTRNSTVSARKQKVRKSMVAEEEEGENRNWKPLIFQSNLSMCTSQQSFATKFYVHDIFMKKNHSKCSCIVSMSCGSLTSQMKTLFILFASLFFPSLIFHLFSRVWIIYGRRLSNGIEACKKRIFLSNAAINLRHLRPNWIMWADESYILSMLLERFRFSFILIEWIEWNFWYCCLETFEQIF